MHKSRHNSLNLLVFADRTTRSMIGYWHNNNNYVVCLSVCLSVTLCVVAKRYLFEHSCLNK